MNMASDDIESTVYSKVQMPQSLKQPLDQGIQLHVIKVAAYFLALLLAGSPRPAFAGRCAIELCPAEPNFALTPGVHVAYVFGDKEDIVIGIDIGLHFLPSDFMPRNDTAVGGAIGYDYGLKSSNHRLLAEAEGFLVGAVGVGVGPMLTIDDENVSWALSTTAYGPFAWMYYRHSWRFERERDDWNEFGSYLKYPVPPGRTHT